MEERIPNIHPCETVIECLAEAWFVSEKHVMEFLNGRARITDKQALGFHAMFGPSRQFWLNLQRQYDEEEA